MRTIPFNNSIGTWVRLVRDGATIDVDRWPGPHGPGSVIHTAGDGIFVCDHIDHDTDSGPEAVYI